MNEFRLLGNGKEVDEDSNNMAMDGIPKLPSLYNGNQQNAVVD